MIIGIDPGLNGAVVVLCSNGTWKEWFDIPIIETKERKKKKRDFDSDEMAHLVRGLNATVYIEKQQTRPKEGRSSTYKTGRSMGLWEGILAALVLPHFFVTARTWQKVMYKGVIGESKDRSLLACENLYPDLPIFGPRGGFKDGRADAALIARYGWLKERGKL